MTAISQKEGEPQPKPTTPMASHCQDLVIGLVYYAGAMGKNFCNDLQQHLTAYGYETPDIVKVSHLIIASNPGKVTPVNPGSKDRGRQNLNRAFELQDLGDEMRAGDPSNQSVLSSHVIREIIARRGGPANASSKRAFIIDSLKHRAEVDLLRFVYGDNFRLIAIHCSRDNRFKRLSDDKFHNAPAAQIDKFIDRDEKDPSRDWGQEVNKVFHQADFFVDNDQGQDAIRYQPDLQRFVDLCVGGKLLRPRIQETGMYHAHASSLRSACLSRQVGAAILSTDGRVLAIGANEVPKYGGGVYSDNVLPDNRCFLWKDWCYNHNDPKWLKLHPEHPADKAYCHNTRKKHELRQEIVGWLEESIAPKLAEKLVKSSISRKKAGTFLEEQEQKTYLAAIRSFLKDNRDLFKDMPGVKDLIEFSRSIHAEMDALMSALRSGTPTMGAVLYTTTYPCHNCARHIVAAGIEKVYYMEPFVKSLAVELHHDSLVHDKDIEGRVAILPFTGVGPRLYAELFLKENEWKTSTGLFQPPPMSGLRRAAPLDKLEEIEQRAADLARPQST